MKERSYVRLARYLLGIILIIIGFTGFFVLDKLQYIDNEIIVIILLFIGIPLFFGCMGFGAILIGRCESFLDEKFEKESKEVKK